MKKMTATYTAISDKGPVRKDNQDNLYCNGTINDKRDKSTFYTTGSIDSVGLFVVADGMGGEANGAEVSYEVVKNLKKLHTGVCGQDLQDYIQQCNDTICKWIEAAGGERMGSTFAAVSIHDGVADIINIGDSRVYLYRDKKIRQLSQDHTVLRPLLDMGVITPEQAKSHPDRHKLTQHIGIFHDELVIEPYYVTVDVKPEDVFLVCSDGVTDALSDQEIETVLAHNNLLQSVADQLLNLSMQNTKDNITLILTRINQIHSTEKTRCKRRFIRLFS